MTLRAEVLTPEGFVAYGKVLRRVTTGEAFQDLHTESNSAGWRVALLACEPGRLGRVHRHPNSEECFAPVRGRACIVVAPPEAPETRRIFQLTEPVLIWRNVWHEVVSKESAEIFIAENAKMDGEPRAIEPPLAWEDPRFGV